MLANRGTKSLFVKNPLQDVLTNFTIFTQNISVFIDKTKSVWQQRGYVASGLKARVMVNKVPLSFSA
jgi:hypothetical protein